MGPTRLRTMPQAHIVYRYYILLVVISTAVSASGPSRIIAKSAARARAFLPTVEPAVSDSRLSYYGLPTSSSLPSYRQNIEEQLLRNAILRDALREQRDSAIPNNNQAWDIREPTNNRVSKDVWGQSGGNSNDDRLLKYRKQRLRNSKDRVSAQSVGSPGRADYEPSCEELRTIWRLTKRAAQHSVHTNKIPTQHTSYLQYLLEHHQQDVNRFYSGIDDQNQYGEFGKIVLEPPAPPLRTTYYPHHQNPPGSLDQLEQQLHQNERFDNGYYGPGELGITSPKSKQKMNKLLLKLYKTAKDQQLKSNSNPNWATRQTKPRVIQLSDKAKQATFGNFLDRGEFLNHHVTYGKYKNPSGEKTHSLDELPKFRHMYKDLKANDQLGVIWGEPQNAPSLQATYSNRDLGSRPPAGAFSTDSTNCDAVKSQPCRHNQDCNCYGFYVCVRDRCQQVASPGKAKSNVGWWSSSPATQLGVKSKNYY